MQHLFANIVGLSGTALVVGAFFLLQLERLNPKQLSYNLMNLSGAVLLLISLCINFNLASFIIELFWISASLVGIVKYLKRSPAMA
ncbi:MULTISPECIES: CBU_0592 family membrane protein [unclassified Agarivorans]|uniref:CBU_0592 family membrane protein n=1 Tax=unclassified Agarivorans TaxID=2636026 RepID=UPI003D7D9D4E